MRVVVLVTLMLMSLVQVSWSYSYGHENESPATKKWYGAAKMPDVILRSGEPQSCCGDYDAYWADEYYIKDGKFYAIITDMRSDKEPILPVGTSVEIPPNKLPCRTDDPTEDRDGCLAYHPPNVTGHGIVFLSVQRDDKGVAHPWNVYCYFYPPLI